MTNISYLQLENVTSQHGGNRLGANSLLLVIYGGTVAGPNAIDYIVIFIVHIIDMDEDIFEKRSQEQERFEKLMVHA